MKDIVTMIEKQVGHEFEIIVDPVLLRPADEKIIAGDITKLKEILVGNKNTNGTNNI